jgi:hypothetical protein
MVEGDAELLVAALLPARGSADARSLASHGMRTPERADSRFIVDVGAFRSDPGGRGVAAGACWQKLQAAHRQVVTRVQVAGLDVGHPHTRSTASARRRGATVFRLRTAANTILVKHAIEAGTRRRLGTRVPTRRVGPGRQAARHAGERRARIATRHHSRARRPWVSTRCCCTLSTIMNLGIEVDVLTANMPGRRVGDEHGYCSRASGTSK